MTTRYERSIFAVELNDILDVHQKSIADLTGKPFSIEWKKVNRLLASLMNPQHHPGLSQTEIITVVMKTPLNDTEYRRIVAALFAVQVQSLLLSWKLPAEEAWHIADEVRLALIEMQERNPELTMGLLRRVPMLSEVSQMEVDQEQDIEQALARALDDYDTGMRCVTLGRLSNNAEEEHLLVAQGYLHLKKADRQLALLAERAGEHNELAEWRNDVQKELLDLEEELEGE